MANTDYFTQSPAHRRQPVSRPVLERFPELLRSGYLLIPFLIAGSFAAFIVSGGLVNSVFNQDEFVEGQFTLCGTAARRNCAVNGDTFFLSGESVRIADIDAPGLHPSRCEAEVQLGVRAAARLQELLNGGPFSLHHHWGDPSEDIFGRKLRVVMRDSRSIGEILIAEGLARPRTGSSHQSWCDLVMNS